MNNLTVGLGRFFKNKNVVTIILVLVALGLLYWGYTSTIKKETNPVSVPVAAQNINPKTRITSDLVTFKTVPASMLDSTVIRSQAQIVGQYTNINVTIPKGSVFYNGWLVSEGKIPGRWIENLDREKELPFYMSVNMESTLGNAVLPESYIDFYMKANDENGTIMFGKFMKDIKVLVVHDGSGKDVFENQESIGSPSKIGFAVSQDYYTLLTKAKYLNIDLIIVPRGSQVPFNCTDGCVTVTSSTLRDYIDAQTITIDEDVVPEETSDQNSTVETPTE